MYYLKDQLLIEGFKYLLFKLVSIQLEKELMIIIYIMI